MSDANVQRYVVSKNQETRQLEVHRANEFYILRDDDTTYERWEPPTGDLLPVHKKSHFGIPKGNFMILHTLHEISGKFRNV